MTRQEQIEEAALSANQFMPDIGRICFINGAQWADANPIKSPDISTQAFENAEDNSTLFLGSHLKRSQDIVLMREAQAHIQTAGTLQTEIEKLKQMLAIAEEVLNSIRHGNDKRCSQWGTGEQENCVQCIAMEALAKIAEFRK